MPARRIAIPFRPVATEADIELCLDGVPQVAEWIGRMIATDCHAEALADYERAVALPDYQLATVDVLRAVGLAASDAIKLVREEADSVELGLGLFEPKILAGSLLTFWEDR